MVIWVDLARSGERHLAVRLADRPLGREDGAKRRRVPAPDGTAAARDHEPREDPEPDADTLEKCRRRGPMLARVPDPARDRDRQNRRERRGGAADVRDHGVRPIRDAMPAVPEARAEVRVLAEEEEPFV